MKMGPESRRSVDQRQAVEVDAQLKLETAGKRTKETSFARSGRRRSQYRCRGHIIVAHIMPAMTI
jgi:hypothetical protein